MFAALAGAGVETRAVGGAVRNALLGLPVNGDRSRHHGGAGTGDGARRRAGLKAVPTGIEHGTVTVVADGVPFEVTTLRRDVETFGRHAKVAYTEDWEEDARRRDFTLNALYAGSDGNVFDPLGGYDDLARGPGALHRRCRGAHQGGLSCAFCASSASTPITARARWMRKGLQACGAGCAPGSTQLSAERVAGEMRRILVAPQAIARGRGAVRLWAAHRQLLGGVPRLDALREAGCRSKRRYGLAPDAGAQARGACGLRAKRMPRGSPRACGSPMPSRRCLRSARGDRRGELPGRGSGQAAALSPRSRRLPLAPAARLGGRRRTSPTMQSWRNALALAERWQAPVFPLGGNDVMALGALKGPDDRRAAEAARARVGRIGLGVRPRPALAKAAARARGETQPKIDPRSTPIRVAAKASDDAA